MTLLLPARIDPRRLDTGPRIIPSGEIILQSAVSGAIPGVDVNHIWCTDALNLLRQLPAKSVHCIVTSPPYWNLRDYGIAGQMGSEPTPQAYVDGIVCLFREIRRVLRDDGTIFLNLGDSYVSGAQRAVSCGTSGKELEDYQDRDCLCENLCGVCRVVYQNHRFHNVPLLVAMLTASLSLSSHEHMASQRDHAPTLDSIRRVDHTFAATQDLENTGVHANAPLRASLESTLGVSDPRLLDACLLRAASSGCLLCGRSLLGSVQLSVGTMAFPDETRLTCASIQRPDKNTSDRVLTGGAFSARTEDKACDCSYPDCTTSFHLPPKSMTLIPFRVAIALQDDGWIIRSDIIWEKPNCMPESVKDRPTKAHEYIFLIAKQPQYFYDAEAIKEEAKEESAARARRGVSEEQKHVAGAPGQHRQTVHKPRKNERLGKRQYDGFNARYDASPAPLLRNARSVWTIAPKPLPFDHYAAFPLELAERMILAGCPETVCSACGAPWVRQSEKEFIPQGDVSLERGKHRGKFYHENSWGGFPRGITNVVTTGWKPTCTCDAPTKPGLVLDPFMGAGTTSLVARSHGRSYIGSELNPAYVAIARERLRQPFEQHYLVKDTKLDDLPLFALKEDENVKED